MRISIVVGPWLPVPPLLGGSTNRIWMGLGEEFVRLGHSTTLLARSYSGQSAREKIGGIDVIRYGGFHQSNSLALNLLKDFVYSFQALKALPESDVLVVNDLFFPFFSQLRRRRYGKICAIVGRYPKGQYRFYGGVDGIVVPTTYIEQALTKQAPTCSSKICRIPYPIDTTVFCPPESSSSQRDPLSLLYVGRLHPEKGVHVLLDAISLVVRDIPGASLRIVGPFQQEQGGGGKSYMEKLRQKASGLPVTFLDPIYDPTQLAREYRNAELFCYPSFAEKGESYGVAPLEAMACGSIPVVSHLDCFTDHIQHLSTGVVFDHKNLNPAEELARQIRGILRDKPLRDLLRQNGTACAQVYSTEKKAQEFLRFFEDI